MLAFLADHGFDARASSDVAPPSDVREQPFVFVFGRANFAVSFYGANVFPENVAVGLEQPELADHLTGKFVMEVKDDAALDSELHLAVELAPSAVESTELAARVATSVRNHLARHNSEFGSYVPAERQTPRVRLLPHGDPEYFPTGVKHRYTRP